MSNHGRKITLGLTGGIACYKIPYLVRALVADGVEVRVIMTEAATKFITPLTLETVSGHPVAVAMFQPDDFVATRHIDLGQDCDLLVVAPATANFLGKAANGIADDLLSTVFCAASVPVLVVPAMNPDMWQAAAVVRNVAQLRRDGCHFFGPAEGAMACETSGVGRMSEPDEIYQAVTKLLKLKKKALKSNTQKGNTQTGNAQTGNAQTGNALEGRKIIVTAGPSQEAVDPVRFLSNNSSGKMGYALAAAAVAQGADTVLISGPTALDPPPGARLVSFRSTAELHAAVTREFADADLLIMAAAPADFRPSDVADRKIKKGDGLAQIALEPTIDVLQAVAKIRQPHQYVVGFALETDHGLAHAKSKMKSKNLDMIILNQVGDDTGFDSDTNQITILRPRCKPEVWDLADKAEIARRLVDKLAGLL
jgi:phosphopantothenoylcysteine decarboxylase/phosphopantothenate--cysteine ligase